MVRLRDTVSLMCLDQFRSEVYRFLFRIDQGLTPCRLYTMCGLGFTCKVTGCC